MFILELFNGLYNLPSYEQFSVKITFSLDCKQIAIFTDIEY